MLKPNQTKNMNTKLSGNVWPIQTSKLPHVHKCGYATFIPVTDNVKL